MGFPIPIDNVIFSGSHTHSGPGAISSDFLWALAPATDLMGIVRNVNFVFFII
jgi:hypothetical protein